MISTHISANEEPTNVPTPSEHSKPTWQLIISPEGDDSNYSRVQIEGDGALIGSTDQSDVKVDGPAIIAEVRRRTDGSFQLEIRDSGTEVKCNGETVDNSRAILSGDTITINGLSMLLDVRFPQRPQRKLLRLMSGVTATVLLTVVIMELFVIAWLPARLSKQEVWGVEIARQKTLSQLDGLRQRVRNWENPDERTRAVLALTSHDLQRFAIHLRDHAPGMTSTQLTAVYDALSETDQRLNKLENGTLLKKPASLDPAKFVEGAINKSND